MTKINNHVYKLVGYLSFSILNTFENRTGVIKTLVYSSVTDINQIG